MKLVKSSSDKILFGVCGGIAKHFGWDSSLIRIAFAVTFFAAIGSPVLLYIILAIVMPRERLGY